MYSSVHSEESSFSDRLLDNVHGSMVKFLRLVAKTGSRSLELLTKKRMSGREDCSSSIQLQLGFDELRGEDDEDVDGSRHSSSHHGPESSVGTSRRFPDTDLVLLS